MEQIPTAEEVWDENTGQSINQEEYQAMIEFAKLHVEAALKAASEDGQAKYDPIFEVYISDVDKDSILNSYPLSNIK